MKPKLILIAHGHLAEQVYASAKMVVGEIEGLYTVAMLADDGLDGTRKKLMDILVEIDADTPILIISDMFFGTPCNVSVAAMGARENIRMLTGMNLPMVMEYVMTEIADLDELTRYLYEVGASAVSVVDRPEQNSGEEEYED